jgi:hypothetical protein
MTPEQQRIAIAEACGWYWDKSHSPQKDRRRLISPAFDVCIVWKNGELGGKVVPDYLSDLNAMHEAENLRIYVDDEIDSDLIDVYLSELVMAANTGRMQSATAAQRAEAFLRTIGQLEDDK